MGDVEKLQKRIDELEQEVERLKRKVDDLEEPYIFTDVRSDTYWIGINDCNFRRRWTGLNCW